VPFFDGGEVICFPRAAKAVSLTKALIDTQPTRSVAATVLVTDLPTPPFTVPAVLIDLAFGSEDLDRAQAAADDLLRRGWEPVRGLDTGVFPALFEWCYDYVVDDASPDESRFRIIAGRPGTLDPDDIVYEGLLLCRPEWVAIERDLRAAVVAVGNFSLLEARPDDGGFERRMKQVAASTFADGRVLGATLAPWKPPAPNPPRRRVGPPPPPRRKKRRRHRS